MPLPFVPSDPLTLGVEVELQILDAATWDLAPGAPSIFERLGGPREHIKPELFQSMLEISTGICRSAGEIRRDLAAAVGEVRAAALALNLRLASAGSHPFARHRDRLIYPAERYQGLIDRNRWIARRLLIFGMHVHVGVRDGDHAMALINAITPYLPHLLAVSASSPFWQGQDTGLASCRTTVFEALPTGGHPCSFGTWADFERAYDAMIAAGAITSIKDIWWDIRPHPDTGTIEIRICDGCPTLSETVALVALVHSLCVWLNERYQAGERFPTQPEWLMRENKWRASRWGLDADMVLDGTGRSRSVRIELEDLVRTLERYAARVSASVELAGVASMLRRPGSHERQRRAFERHGSLERVAESLVQEFEQDRPVMPV